MKKLHLLSLALLLLSFTAHSQDYWQKVPSGSGKDLLSISFGNSSTGYIGGTDSTLLKTTDGGRTWSALAHSGIGYEPLSRDIIDVKFLTDSTGYAVLSNRERPELNGTLYKTRDGGKSWAKIPDIWTSVYKTFFFDERNGFITGLAPFAGPTVNRLSHSVWGPVKYLGTGTGMLASAIDFYNDSIGMIGSDYGYVYRTFDGGISWDTVKTNIDTVVSALLYLDENTILASGGYPVSAIRISKDKGATWDFDMSSATFFYPNMRAMARSSRDSAIIVGNSQTTGKGIIYYSDPADSWMNIAEAEQWLNHVTVRNDSIAYIVGDSGLILSNERSVVSVPELSVLKQQFRVYPNPSTGSCNTASAAAHRISVYDLAGRIVFRNDKPAREQQLELGQLPKATYLLEASWDNGEKTSVPLQLR